jgi:hypothetical protein
MIDFNLFFLIFIILGIIDHLSSLNDQSVNLADYVSPKQNTGSSGSAQSTSIHKVVIQKTESFVSWALHCDLELLYSHRHRVPFPQLNPFYQSDGDRSSGPNSRNSSRSSSFDNNDYDDEAGQGMMMASRGSVNDVYNRNNNVGTSKSSSGRK